MSTTIDQRVVEMRFDNKHFEQNVSQTMSTLEKFKQKLNLTGATKGLEDVNAAAKNINMTGLGSAVDTVSTRFSALQVMGVTALANITNSAVNAGKRIVSALTIDPIKTGFQEYETQINAVQTILANTQSKGTTIDQVNEALEELNAYADKTIYNFTEMTRNIGTFTAAGVDLDTSVSAIQGIANLAAVSGSTSQQASTAMYQLSQALATGTVKLQDWNSVVNAGMGGEVFQNALVRTAAALDGSADSLETWRKENIDSYGSFRDSLTKGEWLTTEVLTETLNQFTMAAEEGSAQWEKYKKSLLDKGYTEAQAEEILKMANTATDAATKVKTFTQLWDVMKESVQSGWAQTWKLIVGDFEEAKGLLTPLADFLTGMINGFSDARNRLLEGALDLASPWSKITEKLENSGLGGITKVAEKIEDATDKLEHFQNAVSKVWRGDFGIGAERFKLLEDAGYDSRVIQDLVNKGSDYKITVEDIKASYEKFGLTMSDTAAATTDISTALENLTDDELKNAGLTKDEIDLYRSLAKEAERTGVSINDLVKEMSQADGRTMLIDSFKNAGSGLLGLLNALKEAWVEIFPPMTVVQLYNVIKAVKDFSEKLRLTDKETGKLTETAEKIKRVFKGVFAVLDIVKQVFVAVFNSIKPLFGVTGDLGGTFLDLAAKLGDCAVKFNEFIKSSNILTNTAKGISSAISFVYSGVKKFLSILKDKFAAPGFEALGALFNRVGERMIGLGDIAGSMKDSFISALDEMGSAFKVSGIFKLLQTFWDTVVKIGSGLTRAFGALTGGLVDGLGNANFSGFFDFINSLSLAGITVFFAKFVKGFSDITDTINDFKEGFQENVLGILEEVKGCFEAYQSQLKAGVLLKIASAIAILAASILVISLIDSDKLSSSLGAIAVLFAELMGSLAIFGKVSGNLKGVFKASIAMIAMSTAVLILASALRKIGELEFGEMVTGLVGVFGLTAIVVAAAKILGSGGKTIIKGATQMVVFAAAIKILASACVDLSELSWNQLAKGLVGVGVLLTGVSLFLNNTKFSGKSILTATGIVILAAAIKILASACEDFASMSWGDIAKGLAGVGALLLEIAVFTKLTSNSKQVVSTGIALIAIGAAMKIFASAIQDMSGMSWEELAKGLIGMAGALTAVTLAVNFMPKNIIGIGVGLMATSAALLMLAKVLGEMGGMTWGEIAKGLVALGGSMLILALGLNAMNGTLVGSAAMLVAAAAIMVLAPALLMLGSMSLGSIVKSLITLAAAFAIIGFAGAVLSPLIPTILGLAAAFALIGIGTAAVGVGLLAIGIGIGVLATNIAAGATAIVAGLTVIITGIAGLIPVVIAKIGEGIIAFCNVIAEGVPALGSAIKAVVLTLLDVIIECVPQIVDVALRLIVEVMAAIVEHTPRIVDLLFTFVIAVLDGITARLPELIQSAVNVIMAFFSGIIDALSGIDVETLIKGIAGVGLLAGIMAALAAVAGLIPGAMVGVLGIGAVIAELALVLAAIGALAQIPGLEWLINEGAPLLESIGVAIGSLVGGIVGGIMGGITSQLPKIGSDLSAFMLNAMPFIAGVKMVDASMLDGVKALASMILTLTAANVLDGLTLWLTGGSSLANFGKQLIPFGDAMVTFSQKVSGNIDESAVTATANAGKVMAEMAATLPNSGGVAGWFAGNNDLSTFGDQLIPFASAMVEFSSIVSGNIDEGAVTAAANTGRVMAEMANALPNSGGVAGWFAGNNDMGTFGGELVKFGKKMVEFSEEINGTDFSNLSSATSQFKGIVDIAKTVAGVDVKGLGSIGDALGKFGKNSVQKFIDAFNGAETKASNAAKKLVDAIVNTLKNSDTKTSDSAKKIMENFSKAITESKKTATKAISSVLSCLTDSIKDKYSSFYSAGSYLVDGFAAGISENDYKAEAKARAMAEAAIEAAKDELDQNSPSRVFYDIGSGTGEGFVNALGDYSSKVYRASADMASNARTGFSNAIKKISDMINLDIDAQPTIRPVLDLSDISDGAGTINRMFGMSPSVGVLSEVNAISSSMNSRQNGTNDDVISAINKLGKGLENVGNTSYNVNGITYDDGSNVSEAIKTLIRAAKIERRV